MLFDYLCFTSKVKWMADLYALLELPQNASEEDIRKAYRRLAKKYHPDVNKSQDAHVKFVLIKKAYDILIDKNSRFQYDQKHKQPTNPYQNYEEWLKKQQAKREAEEKLKQRAFNRRKEELRKSKMYYPYMVILYFVSMAVIATCIIVLIICAFLIVRYHIFMFFFLLPFICVAAYVFKVTLDAYRKHRALFI